MAERSIILIDGLKTIFTLKHKVFYRDDVINRLSKYIELEYEIWLNFNNSSEEETWNTSATIPQWLKSKVITVTKGYDQIKGLPKSGASFSIGTCEIPSSICGPYYDRIKIFGPSDLGIPISELNSVLDTKVIVYIGPSLHFVKNIKETVSKETILLLEFISGKIVSLETVSTSNKENITKEGIIIIPDPEADLSTINTSLEEFLKDSTLKFKEKQRPIMYLTDGKIPQTISDNIPLFHWSI